MAKSQQLVMSYTFSNPIKYSLVKDQNKLGDLETDFNKINDYLLTFVGEIGVAKEKAGQIEISYSEVPYKAMLKTDSTLPIKDSSSSSQITLTCEREDFLSVNLIKNVTGNIGYRIFNPQTNAYLVNDANLLDLTSINVDAVLQTIFSKIGLTPLFQYRNSLVFFCSNKQGGIHLVNRHLLEFLKENPNIKFSESEFSTLVARNVACFIALFDRGLIPISYYENLYKSKKIINQSGFNEDSLSQNVFVQSVFFVLDEPAQSFVQIEANRVDFVKKGKKLLSFLKPAMKDSVIKGELLCAKVARDISFLPEKNKLIPKLTISIFLD